MGGPISLSCIRCQGAMEPGSVIDEGQGGTRRVGIFVAGHRCQRFGYLESYA